MARKRIWLLRRIIDGSWYNFHSTYYSMSDIKRAVREIKNSPTQHLTSYRTKRLKHAQKHPRLRKSGKIALYTRGFHINYPGEK